jgi:Ca-activated chloride channel family protein
MSFAAPLVLLALLALPPLVVWYTSEQRRRIRAAQAFVTGPLTASVAPRRPRWRRHAPLIAFGLALAVLIVAAARPQRTKAVPIGHSAIMLANDVSSSMLATDVKPSRLVAAQKAATSFIKSVPSTVQIGSLEFSRRPVVLQSPTTDHSLTLAAIKQFRTSGGTAIGDSLVTALRLLTGLPKQGGQRPPGAILLLSDGANNVGSDPLQAARQAATLHIPIYTVELGTPSGTIPLKRGSQTVITPVPTSPAELAQIASLSHGHAWTAQDTSQLSNVYTHLAAQLTHKKTTQPMTASFAGGGLVLLLLGSVLSLGWFGRLV